MYQITESLEEEIRYINSRSIDTVVEVSTEATEENASQGWNGIVLSCCYKGNALSPNVSYLQAKEYALVISPGGAQFSWWMSSVCKWYFFFNFFHVCSKLSVSPSIIFLWIKERHIEFSLLVRIPYLVLSMLPITNINWNRFCKWQLSRTSLYLTVLPTYPACSPHVWFDNSNPQAM